MMCMNEWSVKSQHGNPSLTTLVAKTENIKSLPRNVFSDEDADTVDTSLSSVPLPCRILHLTSYVSSVCLRQVNPKRDRPGRSSHQRHQHGAATTKEELTIHYDKAQ